jgi:hypothetical protein
MSFTLHRATEKDLATLAADLAAADRYTNFAFTAPPDAAALRERCITREGLVPVWAVDESGKRLMLLGVVLDDGLPYFELAPLIDDLDPGEVQWMIASLMKEVFSESDTSRILYYLDAGDAEYMDDFINAGFERVSSPAADLDGEVALMLERGTFEQLWLEG